MLSGLPSVSSLRPGTLQSDIDTFCSDRTLRLVWKVLFVGVSTKLGREHKFTHRKIGGSFLDVDIIRRRDRRRWLANLRQTWEMEAGFHGDQVGTTCLLVFSVSESFVISQ